LHRVEEDWGGLVAGHVRSPPVSRQNELVYPTLYKPSSAGIKGENKSFTGEKRPKAARSCSLERSTAHRVVPGRCGLLQTQFLPLHPFVKMRQTNERHLYSICHASVSTPQS